MSDRLILIIPDTTPLIHLAAGGLLGVLPAVGHVVVPDVVELEAIRLPNKPWAAEIGTWLKAAAVEIVVTGCLAAYQLALAEGRRPRNAGENSILAWLRANPSANDQLPLVLIEDRRFARRVAWGGPDVPAIPLTITTFLELAERRGIIPSAAVAIQSIVARAPTASAATNLKKPSP